MTTGDANKAQYPDGYANGGILKAPMDTTPLVIIFPTKGSRAIIAGILMGKKPSGATPRIKTNAGSIASPR